MEVFLGLGNHDYQNNVDDCYLNHCASRMTKFMINFYNVNRFKPYYLDYPFDYRSRKFYKFPAHRYSHQGSLSYSWDIGEIHFVQLHNYPSYHKTWKALYNTFTINPSYEWLKKDLTKAAKKNKKIIINMHSHQHAMQDKKFLKIIKNYNVSAIFAGHLHSKVGKVNFPSACQDTELDVPCFLSGAAVYRSILTVRFIDGKQMIVEAFRGKQHPPKLDPPYRESTETYTVKLKKSRIPTAEEEIDEKEKEIPQECYKLFRESHGNLEKVSTFLKDGRRDEALKVFKEHKEKAESLNCESLGDQININTKLMEQMLKSN